MSSTLSLHDALPIWEATMRIAPRITVDKAVRFGRPVIEGTRVPVELVLGDRKSTRLNSSHANISYAVFCLKKKKIKTMTNINHTRNSISDDNRTQL